MADVSSSLILHGKYDVTLDDKSRLTLPALFRRKMNSEVLYLLQGIEGDDDNLLLLYSPDKWNALVEKFESTAGDFFSQNDRTLIRNMIGSSHEVFVDKSGRILVPADLCEYAGLSKDCVIVGMINYLEIWDKETLRERSNMKNTDNRTVHKTASEDMSRRIKKRNKKGEDN